MFWNVYELLWYCFGAWTIMNILLRKIYEMICLLLIFEININPSRRVLTQSPWSGSPGAGRQMWWFWGRRSEWCPSKEWWRTVQVRQLRLSSPFPAGIWRLSRTPGPASSSRRGWGGRCRRWGAWRGPRGNLPHRLHSRNPHPPQYPLWFSRHSSLMKHCQNIPIVILLTWHIEFLFNTCAGGHGSTNVTDALWILLCCSADTDRGLDRYTESPVWLWVI